MSYQKTKDDERKEESQRILDRVHRDSETAGRSSVARTVDSMRGHFSGADAESDDKVEVWGRRIGRTLGALFAIGLIIYLVITYILP